MNSKELFSPKLHKTNQRRPLGDSLASVPSPQDPFIKKNNIEIRKSHTQSIHPIEITGQPVSRTTKINTPKKIRFSKTVTSKNMPISDPISQSLSLFSSSNNQVEKTKLRVKNPQDIKIKQFDDQIKIDEEIESFILKFPEKPIHTSIEDFISSTIESSNVIFWYEISSIQRLYSPKLDKSISHNEGLVGFTFSQRMLLKIPIASQHIAYNETIDGPIVNQKSSLLLFPLLDNHENIIGVVEVQKKFTDPLITESDETLATEFMKKFKTFSHWLLDFPIPNKTIVDLMNLYEIGQFLLIYQKKMKKIFNCNNAEIWRFDKNSPRSIRYVLTAENIQNGFEGIIGSIYQKLELFNCSSNKMHSSYYERTDGSEEAAILAYPIYDKSFDSIFTIVMRGKPKKMFTNRDEKILTQIGPFILTSFKNSIKFSEAIEKNEQIKVLNEITSILPDVGERQKPSDIVTRGMEILEEVTDADRGTFYVCDEKEKTLNSLYSKNVKDPISQHFGRGLSGNVAKTAEIHNTIDAYEDVRFDSSIDLITGYKTKSILTVPIIDATGIVVSVIQLLNKKDWNPFNQIDIDSARICGTICSCLINNAIVNGRLSQMTKKTTNFFQMIPDLLKNEDYETAFQNILPSIRRFTQTERVVLYIIDQASDVLVPIAWDDNTNEKSEENEHETTGFNNILTPENVSLNSGIASSCVKTCKAFFVNDILKDGRIDSKVDFNFHTICIAPLIAVNDVSVEKDTKLNEKVFSQQQNQQQQPQHSPMTSSRTVVSTRCIGVVEVINKNKVEFDESDLTFMKCAATVISLFLGNKKLQSVVKQGKVLWKLDRLISPIDRSTATFPKKMRLPIELKATIDSIQFFVYDLKSNDSDIKLVFFVFNKYKLMEKFQIDNETLFTAICAIKETYHDNVYHNWMHALDSIQFLMVEIEKAKLTSILDSAEIFALFIATLFSFSEHDGTYNSFQKLIGTPIGILFEGDPLTMSRCISAIRVLTRDECNLMKNIDAYNSKMLWKLILTVLKDTIVEFENSSTFIEECQKMLKTSSFDLNNIKHREMFFIILFRCACLSPFARPFGVHLKWQPIFMNAMFYMGDQENLNGLDFTSRHNSRDHHIKALAMIELIEKFAYPAFEVLSGMKVELKSLFENVKDNLTKWKDRRR